MFLRMKLIASREVHSQRGDAIVPVGRNGLVGDLLGGLRCCASHPTCRRETGPSLNVLTGVTLLWVKDNGYKCCKKKRT